ncbi:MAG: M48 family metallopeptidase [Verrucomicrobiota bacterium]
MEMDDQPITVHVAGKAVLVWPKVSARATRVRLSVKPGPKVVLTYPPHASHASALAFLRDNLPWLGRVLAKARPLQPSLTSHLRRFPWVTLDDRLLAIEMEQGVRGAIRVSRTEDKVRLVMPSANPEPGAVRVIRRLAETGLSLAVDRLSRKVGVTVQQVGVRDQTTRWGSCSAAGTLSLNWRLVLLPPLLHDHVILHELSHRRHMDHSDRFWAQLAAWDPYWQKHDRELNKRWNVIMDLGR